MTKIAPIVSDKFYVSEKFQENDAYTSSNQASFNSKV